MAGYNLKRIKSAQFIPKNPHKILNKDLKELVSKSSWEHYIFVKLDTDPNIKAWGYEVAKVKYIKATDGRQHTYYIDIFCIEEIDGVDYKFLYEIKPKKFIMYPPEPKRKTPAAKDFYRQQFEEVSINISKFNAAYQMAQENGMFFKILMYEKADKESGVQNKFQYVYWKPQPLQYPKNI